MLQQIMPEEDEFCMTVDPGTELDYSFIEEDTEEGRLEMKTAKLKAVM